MIEMLSIVVFALAIHTIWITHKMLRIQSLFVEMVKAISNGEKIRIEVFQDE